MLLARAIAPPGDVCYSWWILVSETGSNFWLQYTSRYFVQSALSILGRVSWIDPARLAAFIIDCQDTDAGGISDRPGNMADV